MLAIAVQGKYLFIPEDTALTLEQASTAFGEDNFGSDIVWTFDLPAEPNARVLGLAHYTVVSHWKRYACTFSLLGVPVATGQLYIQQVTDERVLSCGAVLDGLGATFGERKLSENDYGEDVAISDPTDSLEEHRRKWRLFLQRSLEEHSVVKFPLFYDPDFYKDNDQFGRFRGEVSPLQNSGAADLGTHFVNRLFVDADGNIIENPATYRQFSLFGTISRPQLQGLRIFNERSADGTPCNGYAFAPAIRLQWLLRRVFGSEGFSLCGTFMRDERIERLFVQSMEAMDGDLASLGITEHLYIASGATGCDPDTDLEYRLDVGIGQGEHTFKGFRLAAGAAPAFNWSFRYDTDTLARGTQLVTNRVSPYQLRDEVLLLMITPADRQSPPSVFYRSAVSTVLPNRRDFVYGNMPWRADIFGPYVYSPKCYLSDNNMCTVVTGTGGTTETNFLRPFSDIYCIQLTSSTGNTIELDQSQEADVVGNFIADRMQSMNKGIDYVVRLCVARIDTVQQGEFTTWADVPELFLQGTETNYYSSYVQIPRYGQLERVTIVDAVEKTDLSNTNTLLNVFDRSLRWRQHVPDMTNADFVKAVCEGFGLVLFTDPFEHGVQLDFFADVLRGKALDVDEFVTSTQRMTYDPHVRKVGFSPLLGTAHVADDYLLPKVGTAEELPPPRSQKRRSAFVENEMAYRTSSENSENHKFYWEQLHGDDRKLEVGTGDSEKEETLQLHMPCMHLCDSQRTEKLLAYVKSAGCSKLQDADWTGSFPLIIQQLFGLRPITLQTSSSDNAPFVATAMVEYANPTGLDEQARPMQGALSLSAVGANSVGELFLKPKHRFLATAENYRFTLRMPVGRFFDIRRLLSPQPGTPTQQVRWLLIGGQRYLPSRITYQFSTADHVLVTVECSRPHMEK